MGSAAVKGLAHRIINVAGLQSLLKNNRVVPRVFFEYKYRTPDPYGARAQAERDKFDHAFALLRYTSFDVGLEIGCGEGVHTWRVAERCRRVLAIDLSSRAITRARRNNAARRHLEFATLDIVGDAIPGQYDYIFCAETLYYLHRRRLRGVTLKILSALKPGGILHLLDNRCINDDSTGVPFKQWAARTTHEAFLSLAALQPIVDEQTDIYRITILRRGV
jgi:SAM-dependent methyltransferase